MKCVVTSALFLAAAGCTPSAQESDHRFAVPSDAAAEEVVRSFLDAAKARDPAKLATQLCDKGDDGRARAATAIAGPLRIEGYGITRVEPAWVGAEPYFRVDVTLQRAGAVDPRSLSVRVRDGCVDRLLNEPVEAAQRNPGEISL